MPDVLSPHERAAIAAFPESRVTRVPLGASGLTVEDMNGLHWRERNAIARRLFAKRQRIGALIAREQREP